MEAYKILGRKNQEDREQCMMMTFVNGLISKKAKFVLQELKPKTLDECYQFIKDDEATLMEEDSIEQAVINQMEHSSYQSRIK